MDNSREKRYPFSQIGESDDIEFDVVATREARDDRAFSLQLAGAGVSGAVHCHHGVRSFSVVVRPESMYSVTAVDPMRTPL
jgi:hypothetical protein